MPIPAFTIDGVLPPYVGPQGPGGLLQDMTPYAVTAFEVAVAFGTSDNRRDILVRWLDHRARLRALGFDRGFQWLDGSFVEDKEPGDLDVVTFLYRPPTAQTAAALNLLIGANLNLFDRGTAKQQFRLDTFFIDLNGSSEALVDGTRYLNGLFSHRRGDDLWKGMLNVRLEDANDDLAASAHLNTLPAPVPAGVPGP